MTTLEQIIAIAELDGLSWIPSQSDSECCWRDTNNIPVNELPNYLTSRDAIIPVIEKTFDQWQYRAKFQPVLSDITFNKKQVEHAKAYFCATPQQLAEALLRATEKWKD